MLKIYISFSVRTMSETGSFVFFRPCGTKTPQLHLLQTACKSDFRAALKRHHLPMHFNFLFKKIILKNP